MHILNVMLGRNLGGIEQAAVDYHEALCLQGYDVTTILHPKALTREFYSALPGNIDTLSFLGEWDMLAAHRLRKLGQTYNADMALCHGNRAIGLALGGLSKEMPIVGVAHNYKIKKRFPKCDGVMCITRDLIEEMVHLDMQRHQLFHIPNMIRYHPVQKREQFSNPPVIGSMGRFVEKKGFDIFLQSLHALKEYEIDFKAKLGGDGPLKNQLFAQCKEYGLENQVEFIGWVEDKRAFFESLDIFVLPSHHEPFGIVLIEAMAEGLPCITTDTEGPCEIIKQYHDAIMIEKARPYEMASTLRELIENPEHAMEMGYHAHLKARDRYDIQVVSESLRQAIESLMSQQEPTASAS
ncbi:MAG: glycosyltransferase family 4 protein [Rickettsiales bacterium]|nr:glycosyltransferase family 4 protein [Rickettsiales bacterium]